MRAKRRRVLFALIVVLALAAIPWAHAAWRRHQNVLACRKAYAELAVYRPDRPVPGTREVDGSAEDRFSVAEQVRAVEREVKEPFVISRVCRDPNIQQVLDDGKVSAENLAELIHTSADVGMNLAYVRVWIEGDIDPKDAAQLTNAVASTVVEGLASEYYADRRQDLAALKAVHAKEAARRAELKDQVQALTRRIETGRRASQSRATKSQQSLVERLDEMLVEFKSQRILLLAEQSAVDDGGELTTGTVDTALVEGTSADPPDDEPAPNSSFKRRLAKLDRKIEFFKRSIEELTLEPSNLSSLELDEAELRAELTKSKERVEALDDAIWQVESKLENELPPVRRYLDAEAPSP